MKFKLTFLALVTLSIGAFAQSKNSLSVQYGTAGNGVNIHGAIGDFGYDGKGGSAIGLGYEHFFTNSLSLQTGFLFTSDKVEINSIMPPATIYRDGTIKMVTIPVLARYTFWKYLFVDGGLTADIQTNYTTSSIAPEQSGIGWELGIGGKYSFGKITVSVNPYIQEHAIIRFNSDRGNYNLIDGGFKFGVGYNF